MKAYAQVDIGNSFLPIDSPFRGEGGTIGNVVSEFLPILFFAASALTAVYFIYGAIQYIYSGGDPKSKEAAQKKITYAILGFTLVTLSFLFSQFLGRLITISPTRRFEGRELICNPSPTEEQCTADCPTQCSWFPERPMGEQCCQLKE